LRLSPPISNRIFGSAFGLRMLAVTAWKAVHDRLRRSDRIPMACSAVAVSSQHSVRQAKQERPSAMEQKISLPPAWQTGRTRPDVPFLVRPVPRMWPGAAWQAAKKTPQRAPLLFSRGHRGRRFRNEAIGQLAGDALAFMHGAIAIGHVSYPGRRFSAPCQVCYGALTVSRESSADGAFVSHYGFGGEARRKAAEAKAELDHALGNCDARLTF
jgi:hypothetical protein